MIKKILTTSVAVSVFLAFVDDMPVQAGTPSLKSAKQIVGTYLCEGCVATGEVCGFDPIPMVLQFHQDGNFTMNLGTFFERFSGAI